MLRPFVALGVGVALFVLMFSVSHAAVPVLLQHQGRLLDASDTPLDGFFDITYAIFEAPIGGAPLWSEVHPGVSVSDGLFAVTLGSLAPLTTDILAGSGGGGGGSLAIERYLEVRVGADPPISPRLRLAAAPYSVAAGRIDGDIKTGFGVVVIGDTLTDYHVTFGERVHGGLHAAGNAIASGAALITSECESSSGNARLSINTKGTGAKREIRSETNADSGRTVVVADLDDDGAPEYSIESSVDGSGARRRVQSYGIGSSGEDGVEADLRCTPDSITETRTYRENGVGRVTFKAKEGATIARRTTTVVGPANDSTESEAVCDTGGVSLKLKLESTPARLSTNFSVARQTQSATFGQLYDSDGDGVPENEISQSVTPSTAYHAIKTKGTGAESNRVLTIENGATPDSLSSISSIDDDGDTVPESEISESVTPSTAYHAIKTKGTGADANRVLVIQSGATPSSLSSTSSIDDDGDTVPESEISQFVAPTSCSVAINTKGTGADKGRSAGISCNDSLSINYLDIDDDDDGISEAKAVSGVSNLLGGGSGAAAASYARWIVDSDDDGIPEGDLSHMVTPGTCSVAIKVKGTGADKNRGISSDCDSVEAVHSLSADDDGDGLVDRSVTSSADTATAQVVASGSGISVGMKVKNKGVIKGAININNGFKLAVDFDSDGLGYIDSLLGVGVTPSHRIDVVGGAYCDGTNWVNASDANAKENFEKVDGAELLEKLSALEISKWNYKGNEEAEHIGPTAQDFKKAFGVGADDKSISTIDPSGIALAAIKELYAQLKQKNAEIARLQETNAKQLDELRQQLSALQAAVNKK